ncbi:MAG: hypothetical protein GY866_17340 [Proteobacteria bacterium]|nr:hypothetical protein [Pseudomonadota bacterium]
MAVSEEDTIIEYVEELVSTPKQPAWEFAIEIETAPDEFDTLAKDLSYEPITINVEERNYGAQQVATPVNQERVVLTVTLRGDKNKKLYNWCKKLAAKIVHSDGTFGIPSEYVVRVRIYSSTNKDDDPDPDEFHMIFTNVGAINPDRAANSDYLEFPVTFSQYKTSGSSVSTDYSEGTRSTIKTMV